MFPRTLATAACSLGLLMTGCAFVGDHVTSQQAQLDPASLDAGAALRSAAVDAQWPDVQWWRAYHDPQLDSWVQAALSGSPTLELASARVREARAMASAANAALDPQVNGNLSLQRKHWPSNAYYGPGAFDNTETWNNTGTLGLTYELDLWGRNKNSALSALDIAHERAIDERAAALELEVNVVRTYVDLSARFATLNIEKDTLERQRELTSLADRRLKAGLGTQLDLSQAEAPLPDYERRVDATSEQISLDRNQLATLAGKGPGAGDAIREPQLDLVATFGLPSHLPAELIGHRPDVVAARWAVAATARDIDVAKADFYPNIDLLATVGAFAAGGPLTLLLHAGNGGWTAGPALSLPIFDGGRLRAQLGAASAEYDEAVALYNQTIVTALGEIADQVVRLRSLNTQETEAQRYLQNAGTTFRLSEAAYRRGLTDYVNVLIAQTRLLDAQQDVVNVHAEELSAYASLVASLGGGLAEPGDGATASEMQPAIGSKRAAQIKAKAESRPDSHS
ncbi:efflux transporter outer membrane subunit [Paraburkholderia sp. LEh10]|uniref:efflux transporter outer membrane subunit n=1 Tax=Paraburkholderia sp. LEh10 TaxID=2821353 RepID=UPI001AE7F845|nr:efflux transporter outer membrane subunit [Paraburkholderia sp. LEh10]MBP0594096.1 efflux transporter outer membrane subunit [Paraburkholderia sp. LEh10]